MKQVHATRAFAVISVIVAVFIAAACGSSEPTPREDGDAAALDAQSSDMQAPIDAPGLDVADSADVMGGSSSTFDCGSGSLLCATFEGVNAPSDGWTQVLVQRGSASLDVSAFTSPTHSFASTTTADGLPAKAVLSYSDSSNAYSTMSARFTVRVHQVGEPITILEMSYAGVNTITSVALTTDGTELYLVSGSMNQPVYPIALDAWTEVVAVLRPGLDVKVVVNGKFTKVFAPPLDVAFVPSHTTSLGVQAPGNAIDVVQFDDAVLRGLN